MPEEKLKHILDYKLLKAWGFVWAEKRFNGKIVTAYLAKYTHTDMFGFDDIHIAYMPNQNVGNTWIISLLETKKVLFEGVIPDKETLEVILKSTLIFKPNK